jgi:DNA helicase-2/ATP-dependent DNA helicase PcrA
MDYNFLTHEPKIKVVYTSFITFSGRIYNLCALILTMELAEREEREYLEEIKEKLVLAIKRADDRVKEFSTELRQNKEYIYEHLSGMDEADMVSAGQSINRMAFTGESAEARKRKLFKLVDSPYFGRIDFGIKSRKKIPLYIGM